MRGRMPVPSARIAEQAHALTLRFQDGTVDVRVEKEKKHGGEKESDL